MSSKSVIILGIVFIFLLNVIAVHNYIDKYYYQTEETNLTKIELTPKHIILKTLSNSKEHNMSKKDKKQKNIVTKELKIQKIETNSTAKTDNKIIINKNLKQYKSHYTNSLQDEKNSLNNIIKQKEETKNTNTDENTFITLTLDIDDPYEPHNPIIKKIAKNLDSKKIIKIKIYKYSIKLKKYLEKIKYNFAELGVDIDDIRVIYNKNEAKQNKIKILLTKKD